MTVNGHQIQLSENRSVFVGSSDKDDLTYIKFINGEGVETAFKLSPVARRALVRLLVHPEPLHLKHQGAWTYVIRGEAPVDA